LKKIVILTGSPHHPGTSESLADSFEKGAREAGNELYRFDAGRRTSEFSLLQLQETPGTEEALEPDDIITKEVMPKLIEADVVVLVSSLYYYGINAALKAVIDRFYAYNHDLHGNNGYKDSSHGNHQAITLISCYGQESAFRSLKAYFDQLLNYMRWDRISDVLASDALNGAKLKKHQEEAYQLGKSIH